MIDLNNNFYKMIFIFQNDTFGSLDSTLASAQKSLELLKV